MIVRFLIGIDDNSDPQMPRVSFERLQCLIGGFDGMDGDDMDGDGLIETCLQVGIHQKDVKTLVPGGFQTAVHTIPQLAADPTDPNRLYLVYHDTETDSERDKDVNVYLSRIVFDGDEWTVLPRVLVNTDENPATDQFLPSIVVDDFGVIHVIFYDDREYVQDDSAADAKYDVWYAMSIDGGETFPVNEELYGLDGLPAYDETTASTILDKPGEYIGITYFTALDQIWTSYTGTQVTPGGGDDETVIFSSKIQP